MFYDRTIRLADTDAAGVIYFASLLSICHEAYEACLEKTGISLQPFLKDASCAIPIVHAEIDFQRPIYYGDQIRITVTPQFLSETEFESEYLITKISEPETFALAKTRHVCIDPQKRRRMPLPTSIMAWLDTKN
ncbi:1,4-dihydroxy-2-naphthoyl-CoA hydrolase [Aphanothece hegewaldii CCALA 016]|uniref:1,4-dihydroxy-2-naphthoyl-CoA hydrolase n=1 Tax=Aphanothece hegewaldii CCALA 016 TaxID=2107694 RepID=A0A2T1M2H4_9CHRO|nr:thioesterase family protein [Aphanothece hegewaldii]PSF38955.1 1,4-dihydroxy-2-naphthoyl-CoA hydrolase [Aphanothece hegewaldii CCALA 016]